MLCVKAGGETEICEFDVAAAVEENVVRFDVAFTRSVPSSPRRTTGLFPQKVVTLLGMREEIRGGMLEMDCEILGRIVLKLLRMCLVCRRNIGSLGAQP